MILTKISLYPRMLCCTQYPMRQQRLNLWPWLQSSWNHWQNCISTSRARCDWIQTTYCTYIANCIYFNSTNIFWLLILKYYQVRLKVFFLHIPWPTRCFKCQKFRHGQNSCTCKDTCFRCGEIDHDGNTYTNSMKCSNCLVDHILSL